MTRLCTCPGSLASSLQSSRKRNQPAEISCKTCGGRFLVDGIGPLSGNMLGTVGLEVTNSINSELNWNTVTKGKRSRKPVARSLNGRSKLSKSPKRVGDFSGSDSDRFGDTVIGQSFPDRIEYVPIKKRRHLLRSASPPPQAYLGSIESLSPQLQTLSSQSEEFERLSDQNGSSGHQSSGSFSNRRGSVAAGVGKSGDGVVGDKVSEVTGGKLYNSEDFSGIALLAAAACINNDDCPDNAKGDAMEVSSTFRRCDTSTSAVPSRESISCSESEKLFPKDVSQLELKKCSSVAGGPYAVAHSSDKNKEDMAVSSNSSKVDRRHWDLNTLMEAWDEPHKDGAVENTSTTEASIEGLKIQKFDREDVCAPQLNSGNAGNDSENHVSVAAMDKAVESCESILKEEEVCCDRSCIMEQSISNADAHSQEALNLSSDDAKHESLDKFPLADLDNGSGTSVSGEKMETTSGSVAVIQVEGIHVEGSRNVRGTLETTEQKVALHEVPDLSKSGRENDVQVNNAENSQKTSQLPESITPHREEISTEPCNTLDSENSESTSEDHSHALSKCEDMSTSDISVGGQSSVFGDPKGPDKKGPLRATDVTRTEVQVAHDSKEVISQHDDHLVSNGEAEKISNAEDSAKALVSDDCHKSDVSQDDRGHLGGTENNTEHQVDYDSPYEDGELRGSVLYSWYRNDLEDAEQECVDYESDGRVGEDSDGGDYPGSEIVETGSEGSQGTEKKHSLAVQLPEMDTRNSGSGKSSSKKELKEQTDNTETGGRKGSNQGSGTTGELFTDVVVDRNAGRRKCISDYVNVFDAKRSQHGGEVGAKATRWKLQSRIEGPTSFDISERKEAIYAHQNRSRNMGGSLSRLERDSSPDRFVTRYRSSVYEHQRGDGRWNYWDSRNRCQSSYQGPQNHGQTRPRSAVAADSIDKFGGLNSHDHKQPINYSSKGMQRPFVRRRSPIERDEFYGTHRRMAGFNINRRRGISGNFSEGISKSLRDEYGETVVDDAAASSVRMPHYLSRRDRSFSPPSSRATHLSVLRRKSRSRSRTRSPRAWQSQRERNLGTRRYSRSPEYRAESRMERVRAPFQKPSFAADYGESFMSPPRGRFSPSRSYRWGDERNFGENNLRHRRSPGGMFRRSQKLDPVGLSGRLKSDDYFRPMMRPGRFPFIAGVGKGCKLEENGDDRRHNDRSGMIPRMRHSDGNADVRRSRLDAEDNFEAGNSSNEDDVRSTDRRDVPRSGREDKRSFKVQQ